MVGLSSDGSSDKIQILNSCENRSVLCIEWYIVLSCHPGSLGYLGS